MSGEGERCPCCGQRIPLRLRSDVISRDELLVALARDGLPVTERQLRYWTKIGRIPNGMLGRYRSGVGGVRLCYAPEAVAAIRRYVEGRHA